MNHYDQHLLNYVRARSKEQWQTAVEELDAAIDCAPCAEALPVLADMRKGALARVPKKWNLPALWNAIKRAA